MLTVIIISKNEEANIRRCLESVRFADEVVVVDSGSSDDTVKIAREFTAKVFSTDWKGYGIQKQRALLHATGDWVLNIDADESISPALKDEILAAIRSNEADGYRIAIRMVFYGQPLKYSASPKRHIRLFKRTKAYYSNDIVHEKIVMAPGCDIKKIKEPIMHHSYQDISHVLYKLNKYSSYSAKIRIESGKRMGFVKNLISTAWMFGRCFILQRGFLDGRLGFLFALFSAQGTFFRGLKQLYRDKHINDLPKLIKHKEDTL